VFDRKTTKAEEGSAGASGLSAAMAKQGATLDAAAKSGGKALETLKAGTRALSRAGTVASFVFVASTVSEPFEGDALGTYEVVKIAYDLGVSGFSLSTGPAGLLVGGGGFIMEVSGGKEWAVRSATVGILQAQADRIVNLE